jgi:hypothetical protein
MNRSQWKRAEHLILFVVALRDTSTGASLCGAVIVSEELKCEMVGVSWNTSCVSSVPERDMQPRFTRPVEVRSTSLGTRSQARGHDEARRVTASDVLPLALIRRVRPRQKIAIDE